MENFDFNGKTAVIYARASTQKQDLNTQITEIQAFCKSNGIIINSIYKEKISGAKEHREELEIILDSDPMGDLLIIREISRLSREDDYNDSYYKLQQLIKKYSVYILLDRILIEKGKNDLASDITMMVKLYGAADERRKIRDRTKNAKRIYSQNPLYCANGYKQVPFGLKKIPNPEYGDNNKVRSIWTKNPETWSIVEKIYELKAKGYSYVRVSMMVGLSEEITRMCLKNKTVQALLNDDVLIEKVKEATKANQTNPTPNKHINKYKNKIFLENTNKAMAHSYQRKGGFKYAVQGGRGGTVRVEVVDTLVKKVLEFLMLFTEIRKDEIKAKNKDKINEIETLIDGLEKSLVQNENNLKLLELKYKRAKTEFLINSISEEIDSTLKEIQRQKKQITNYRSELSNLENIDEGEDFDIDSNFQALIDKYIRRIEVYHPEKFHHLIKIYSSVLDNFGIHYEFKVYQMVNWRIEDYAILTDSGEKVQSFSSILTTNAIFPVWNSL